MLCLLVLHSLSSYRQQRLFTPISCCLSNRGGKLAHNNSTPTSIITLIHACFGAQLGLHHLQVSIMDSLAQCGITVHVALV